MKVILLEDIKGVGKKGQIINASDGHARNYLIPKKLGLEATDTNLRQLEQKKKSLELKIQHEKEEAMKLKELLESRPVTVAVKIGENGKLFGSVTAKEVGTAIDNEFKIEIDKKKIVLPDPIKTVGDKEVPVKLYKEVTAKVAVKVQEQK